MAERVKVCIRVEGGNVIDVMSGTPLDVVVVDYDNIEKGDPDADGLFFEDGVTNAREFMDMPATQGWY
jgi:hypothetical protein